jgi:tetratricopeptide (TPR) repeat protein
LSKKVTEIVEIPKLDPELKKLAEADGVKFVARSPQRLKQFMTGAITLGELEGIDKETQYRLAKNGHTLMSQGKLAKAKTVFVGLMALDPFDAYFHTALGAIAYQEKDLDTAMTHFDQALEINPFFSTARAHRGEIRLSRDDLTGAIEDLIQAVECDPKNEQPATKRARALIGTIQQLMKKIEADPHAAKREAEAALSESERNE